MIVERVIAEKEPMIDLMEFLMGFPEEADGIPDEHLAAGWVYDTVMQGMTFVAREENGGPILGSIGLVTAPLARWFPPERRMLADEWFLIKPAHRFSGVRKALTEMARQEGRRLGLPAYVFKRVRLV